MDTKRFLIKQNDPHVFPASPVLPPVFRRRRSPVMLNIRKLERAFLRKTVELHSLTAFLKDLKADYPAFKNATWITIVSVLCQEYRLNHSVPGCKERNVHFPPLTSEKS